MSRGIFLIDDKEQLVELREQPYDSEAVLQRLLADYPSLLAGDLVNRLNPRRWLLVAREISVPGEQGGAGRWSLDHLFLDQDAVPTLVEVKRGSDTRIRREVVGQMLDYAANAVVYWPVEHLIEQFGVSCRARGADPDREIEVLAGSPDDASTFWQRVKTNLQAGRIRMLFVADEIPSELRRIVEFLNVQMDPAEVLAVEIKQFASGAFRTLIPTVIGQTAEATGRKQAVGERRQWDEATFFNEFAQRGDNTGAAVARGLLSWAVERKLRVWWGKGQQEGAFVPVLDLPSASHQPFAVRSTGAVEIYFYWYAYKPPFNDERRRVEILHRLNQIPGVTIPESALSRRPSIPLSVLAREGSLETFLGVFDWYLDEVRAAESASPTPDFSTDE